MFDVRGKYVPKKVMDRVRPGDYIRFLNEKLALAEHGNIFFERTSSNEDRWDTYWKPVEKPDLFELWVNEVRNERV